jgi:hypothetical protein
MSMSLQDQKTIRSHEEFRRLLPKLVAQQEERPALAIAALANPILALEELGYSFAPEIRPHMERLARFGEDRTVEIEQIEQRLAETLGPEVDIADRRALAAAVISRLPVDLLAEHVPEVKPIHPHSDAPAPVRKAEQPRAKPTKAPAPKEMALDQFRDRLAEFPQRRFDAFVTARDPLAALKGRAPLLDDMIRLREIEGSRARLAEPDVFQGLLSGKIRTPISRVRFVPSKGGKRGEG